MESFTKIVFKILFLHKNEINGKQEKVTSFWLDD